MELVLYVRDVFTSLSHMIFTPRFCQMVFYQLHNVVTFKAYDCKSILVIPQRLFLGLA
jgi:hypothetical protein